MIKSVSVYVKSIFFTIDKLNMTNPVTYQVKYLIGSFYTRELSPAKENIFRIEKVIKRKNKMALVKWVGYSDKHNSWVPLSDLINI